MISHGLFGHRIDFGDILGHIRVEVLHNRFVDRTDGTDEDVAIGGFGAAFQAVKEEFPCLGANLVLLVLVEFRHPFQSEDLFVGMAYPHVDVHGLSCTSQAIDVEDVGEMRNGLHADDGHEDPFLVGVGDTFALPVIHVAKHRGPIGHGMHREGSIDGEIHFVDAEGVRCGKVVRKVLHLSCRHVPPCIVADDHVGIVRQQMVQEKAQMLGLELVVGIERLDVFAPCFVNAAIDARAVVAVRLDDDAEGVGVEVGKFLTNLCRPVSAAIDDDEHFEQFHVFLSYNECAETLRKERLHVVGGNDKGEKFVGGHGLTYFLRTHQRRLGAMVREHVPDLTERRCGLPRAFPVCRSISLSR